MHSGDITEAPEGASEFIEIDLSTVAARYIVPQVNVYAGEGFEEVAESFFGFMERDGEQQGRPYEPRTVRMKSDLRGAGRIALPLVFRATTQAPGRRSGCTCSSAGPSTSTWWRRTRCRQP